MKITNRIRRTVAAGGIGWAIADLIPPHSHFTVVDGIILVLAIGIYTATYWIKEEPKP